MSFTGVVFSNVWLRAGDDLRVRKKARNLEEKQREKLPVSGAAGSG